LNNRKNNFTSFDTKIITGHNIKDLRGDYVNYLLEMIEESDGTQLLFYLSPIIKEALELCRIVIIDEIERSLHPLLVKFIISLFNNPDT
jgi:AAA15 family ATPase/GTPase